MIDIVDFAYVMGFRGQDDCHLRISDKDFQTFFGRFGQVILTEKSRQDSVFREQMLAEYVANNLYKVDDE